MTVFDQIELYRKATCKDCKYFNRFSTVVGECRRRAPIIIQRGNTVNWRAFPSVEQIDKCGEIFIERVGVDEH